MKLKSNQVKGSLDNNDARVHESFLKVLAHGIYDPPSVSAIRWTSECLTAKAQLLTETKLQPNCGGIRNRSFSIT